MALLPPEVLAGVESGELELDFDNLDEATLKRIDQWMRTLFPPPVRRAPAACACAAAAICTKAPCFACGHSIAVCEGWGGGYAVLRGTCVAGRHQHEWVCAIVLCHFVMWVGVCGLLWLCAQAAESPAHTANPSVRVDYSDSDEDYQEESSDSD